MPRFVRTRLSVMMFLFYFSVGSWLVTLSTFLMSAPTKGGLNFSTGEVGWIYSSFAIAGMTAPLVIGLLADRLFRADRVFAFAALAMGLLLAFAGWWCESNWERMDRVYHDTANQECIAGHSPLDQSERLAAFSAAVPSAALEPMRARVRQALDRVNESPTVRATASSIFLPLMAIMVAVCFATQICMTLITVISLRNLPDPARDFSRTRMWGTVGWVVAGNALGMFLTAVSSDGLFLGAGSAAIVAAYSFTLPATPPKGQGRSLADSFGIPALKLLRDRSFAVFLFVAFTASMLNQFYVVYGHRYLTDLEMPEPVQLMTIAQVLEVGVMFVIPLMNPRRWMKLLMTIGLIGYVARAAAMRSGWEPAVLVVGVPMHGWSFAFFFVIAATYIDREAPWHLRASAQAVVAMAVSGLGPWLGNTLAAEVVGRHRTGTVINWPPVWDVPLVGCTLALLVFVLFFRPRAEPA
ncbi:MAG: MFS transporter [Bacteroidales bacterium]|nr:MFS transporter [Bacteroidales bacterium]